MKKLILTIAICAIALPTYASIIRIPERFRVPTPVEQSTTTPPSIVDSVVDFGQSLMSTIQNSINNLIDFIK